MRTLTLIGIIMVLCLSLVSAQSPPIPTPVKFIVTLDGVPIDFPSTTITNTATGETLTVSDSGSLRVENGVAFFDLTKFQQSNNPFIPKPFGLSGNTIQYTLCDGTGCTGTFVVDHFSPRTVRVTATTSVPSAPSTGSSGGSGGGSGGSGSAAWTCAAWTDCGSDSFQTRSCTYYSTTRKETRSCEYIPPVPVETPKESPVEPPVEQETEENPVLTPSVPIEVPTPTNPTTPEDEGTNGLTVALVGLVASVLGVFAWGKGFAGLIKHNLKKAKEARANGNIELAKKLEARAEKMAKTALTNFMAGKYKK